MSVLRGTKSFYDYEISDILVENLRQMYSYGFIEMGAFTNIQFNSKASEYTILKSVYDDAIVTGKQGKLS